MNKDIIYEENAICFCIVLIKDCFDSIRSEAMEFSMFFFHWFPYGNKFRIFWCNSIVEMSETTFGRILLQRKDLKDSIM